MDVARFLRLQGAIRAALDSVAEGNAVIGSDAMVASYMRLREEVWSAVPNEDKPEFDRVCPHNAIKGAGGRTDLRTAASHYSEARTLLAVMAGWLDGYVQHARMAMEAEATARERVRQERGVGFRGDQNQPE